MNDIILLLDTSNRMLWNKAVIQSVPQILKEIFSEIESDCKFSLIIFDNTAQLLMSRVSLREVEELFTPDSQNKNSVLNRGGMCNFHLSWPECEKLVKNLPGESQKLMMVFLFSDITDRRQKASKDKRNRTKHIPRLLIKPRDVDCSTIKPSETFVIGSPEETDRLNTVVTSIIYPKEASEDLQ